jgi:glycosyltransferase involved in cell wall biosynthesis
MNIILATVQVPFFQGGAEILSANLQAQLRARGHQVDTVALPFKWYPAETLLQCMVSARMLDLQEVNGQKVDLLIGLKFPAYYARHENKVAWLLHQHRQAYDLWDTPFGDIQHWPDAEWVRETIWSADCRYLAETRARYTISQNVSDRLQKYNGLHSEALYHPPSGYEKLGCQDWEPFIFYPSRITGMKRQALLVEAARHLTSNAHIVFAGSGNSVETEALDKLVRRLGVEAKVHFEGYITEDRKIELLSRCTAVYFGAYDEDYGYVTLEAMFSAKPVLTFSDSGGALEFVRDGCNGYVLEADARALAEKIDQLVTDRSLARQLGRNGLQTMHEKRISWDHVVDTLLGNGHA